MTLTVGALSLGPVARLVVRFGPRPVLLAGICTLIVGLVLFASVPADVPYAPLLLVAFVVMGLGGGSSFVPLLTIAMAEVPPRDAGLASGIMNVSMQVGAALGLALLGALASTARPRGCRRRPHARGAAQRLPPRVRARRRAVVVGLLVTLLVLRSPTPQAEPARDGRAEPQPA